MTRITTVLTATVALLLIAGLCQAQDAKQTPKQEPSKLFKKLDANSDGKVSKEEFQKLTEIGQGRFKDRAKLLDKVFERLDADADGSLTEQEFAKFSAAAKRLADMATPAEGSLLAALKDPEAAFKKLDADKDGKLSKEEFKKLTEQVKLPKLQDRLDQFFGRLDADSNGSLSLEEFKKLSKLGEKLSQRLKKGDK